MVRTNADGSTTGGGHSGHLGNGGGSSAAGRRRPTLRMVAELAGVSTATVSYVFSGRNGGGSGVAEATAKRVLEAAEQLNYRPNRAAVAVAAVHSCLVRVRPHHQVTPSIPRRRCPG